MIFTLFNLLVVVFHTLFQVFFPPPHIGMLSTMWEYQGVTEHALSTLHQVVLSSYALIGPASEWIDSQSCESQSPE